MTSQTTAIKISRFTSDSATTLDTLNKPLDEIEAHLNTLNRIIKDSSQCLIQWDVPLASDVTKGDLVYFNATQGIYMKAIASLKDTYGIEGQSIEADSSKVEGLVISTDNEGGQTALLRQGFYQDSCIINTLGENANSGIYYLSPITPGKASLQPGWSLRQPCLSYYGDNKFSFISHYLAHDSHHHQSFIVPLDGVQLSGTTYSYTMKQTDSLYNRLHKNTCTVFYRSVLDVNNIVSFQENTISWSAQDFTEGDVVIFTHKPFAYGSAIVRTVSSDTLEVNASNGAYEINLKDLEKVQQASQEIVDSNVICSIQQNKAIVRPVVTSLNAGTNIAISKDSKGNHTISAIGSIKENIPLEMSDIALNGVQRVTKGLFTYSTFPANIQTGLVASTYFHYPIQQNTDITVKLALHLIYGDNDCSFNPLIKVYYITTNTDLYNKIPVFTGNGIALKSNEGFLTQTEINIGDISISQNGFFVCQISGEPTSPFNLLKTSFVIKSITSSLASI